MSSLTKRRRVKRATIVAKRSQLAKNDLFKKRSYKPLYEKLKANNNALAKALAKEKQEYQYLFAERIGLVSEVQELKVACNQRDDVISGVLKNAKDTLQLLITMSSHVTNTIVSCQQFAATTRYTPRRLSTNDRRESSTRRLSGKSPARGVVQPMVSGHTITKPTINLSRLNIQRAYRVQNPPNLSDIEEDQTPAASPVAPARTSTVRSPITRPLNYGATEVNQLPERLQNSMRPSDESERRSSVRSNRNSGRRPARRSRENSERLLLPPASPRVSQATADAQSGESLPSPRVALHDVSRLLHNSQSVNIRTLMENSSDIDVTQAQQLSLVSRSDESSDIVSREIIPESSGHPVADSDKFKPQNLKTSSLHSSNGKSQNSSFTDTEDPLEGPSWLLNSSESLSTSHENELRTTINNSSLVLNANDQSKNNRIYDRDESRRTLSESQSAPFVNSRCRGQRLTERTNGGDNLGDDEDDDEDDEQAANLATRWANPPPKFFQNLNNTDDEDETTTPNFLQFVTRKRGSDCPDKEFTLMLDPEKRKKKNQFDLNDLHLPVLESPIERPISSPILEPEQTTNIQRITMTQRGHLMPDSPTDNGHETVFDHTGLMLPMIEENPDTTRPSTMPELNSDEEDARSDKRKRKRVYKRTISPQTFPSDSEVILTPKPDSARPTLAVVVQESDEEDEKSDKRKRKRVYKKRANPPASPSDPEWVPSPKRKNSKPKCKPSRAKDPSSAKVVLLKLNDTHVKKRSPSPEPKISLEFDNRRSKSAQRDVSSDSDGSSVASVTSKNVPSRPRRQKAPTNLQEPSLGKKLRRN